MTKFQELKIAGWRQFGSVHIEFHPRATIITGANGSGKTTLLSILSQHFGWTPTAAEGEFASACRQFLKSQMAERGLSRP